MKKDISFFYFYFVFLFRILILAGFISHLILRFSLNMLKRSISIFLRVSVLFSLLLMIIEEFVTEACYFAYYNVIGYIYLNLYMGCSAMTISSIVLS
jgi:hypothetical protein